MLDILELKRLNQDEMDHVTEILREYLEVFHLTGESLLLTYIVYHKIHTSHDIPINLRPYRFSLSKKKEAKIVVKKIIIESAMGHSKSPYSSTMLITPKTWITQEKENIGY